MFLKPTKNKLLGTALLLVANWVGGMFTRFVLPLVIGTPSTGGAGYQGHMGMGMMGASSYGLISAGMNLVLLAILFYIIIAFLLDDAITSKRANLT